MSIPSESDPVVNELRSLDSEIVPILNDRDSASRLLELLPRKYGPSALADPQVARVWELTALWFLNSNRIHEALGLFWRLYQQMLDGQERSWIHKGMPLVWMSDCYARLGFAVHAKRYLMLTLCEDSLREGGSVSPNTSGVYFRLVWRQGLTDQELRRYATRFCELSQEMPEEAKYPEALLQRVDDRWLTEAPSPKESGTYVVSPPYVRYLIGKLGDGSGQALELLAEYLMACMPGCRTKRRQRSGSTDYDVVCSMEGFEVDFRSEFGRYFVCECKDWNEPADVTVMAKFCRILDSTKSRFGVLFSKRGISGAGKPAFAALEQLKIFQDRGVVIVVLDLKDLESVASGGNLVQLLRERYEAVRLDLRGPQYAG
jgi:hypothetical protein